MQKKYAMIRGQTTWVLLAASALAGTTGCVSWYSGSPLNAGDHPGDYGAGKSGSKRATISIDVSAEVVGPALVQLGAEKVNDLTQKGEEKISRWAEEVFEQTDRYNVCDSCLDSQGTTIGPAYALTISVRDEGEPNTGLAILSGFTLTILPAVASDIFTIDATLRSGDGAQLFGTRSIKQELTTLIEFFMIFGMPFASPGTVEEEMWRAIMADLAAWSSSYSHSRTTRLGHSSAGAPTLPRP